MLKSQSTHFPQLCDGVTVDYDESRGRYVKALRDLPLGTVVCVEEGVTVNISKDRCYRCLKLKGSSSNYCDSCEPFNEPEELANGDFDELGLFKLAAHIVLTYPIRQIMEVMRSPEPVIPTEAPTNLTTSDIESIMQLRPLPQIGDAFQNEHIQQSIRKMNKLLEKHAEWGTIEEDMRYFFFSKALRLVAERSAKNSHVIYSIEQTCRASEEEPLGTGMFPIASLFNHSCTPNVFAFFIENRFIFVSRGVRAGEELVDSYGVTYYQNSLEKRREFLSQVSGFDCNCEKCVNQQSMSQYLVSSIKDPQEIANLANGINDIDGYLNHIENGNKDVETLIKLFVMKPDAEGFDRILIEVRKKFSENPKKVFELWSKFVENANVRGIVFDEYLVRPYLERIILLKESNNYLGMSKNVKKDLVFTVYQLLHTLYADQHPAFQIIEQMLETENANNDLETLVRSMWP